MAYTAWAAGQRITAGRLNDISGIWAAYTPIWSSSGTQPVLGNGTLTGRYARVGNIVSYMIKLTAGSTTTYGTGNYVFSLPIAVGSVTDFLGNAFAGDASVGGGGYSTGTAFLGAGGTTGAYFGNVVGSAALTNTWPMTWANGDRLWLEGCYEAA